VVEFTVPVDEAVRVHSHTSLVQCPHVHISALRPSAGWPSVRRSAGHCDSLNNAVQFRRHVAHSVCLSVCLSVGRSVGPVLRACLDGLFVWLIHTLLLSPILLHGLALHC